MRTDIWLMGTGAAVVLLLSLQTGHVWVDTYAYVRTHAHAYAHAYAHASAHAHARTHVYTPRLTSFEPPE